MPSAYGKPPNGSRSGGNQTLYLDAKSRASWEYLHSIRVNCQTVMREALKEAEAFHRQKRAAEGLDDDAEDFEEEFGG